MSDKSLTVSLASLTAVLVFVAVSGASAAPIVDRFDDLSPDAWPQVAFEDFTGYTTGQNALDGQGDGTNSVGWAGTWSAVSAFGVGSSNPPNSGSSDSGSPHGYSHSDEGANGSASRFFASAIRKPTAGAVAFALSYHGGSGTRTGRTGPQVFLVDPDGNRLFGNLYDGGGGTDGDQFNYHLSDGVASNTTASAGVSFDEKKWGRLIVRGDWSANGNLDLALWVDPDDTVDESNPDATLSLSGVTADIAGFEMARANWSGPGDGLQWSYPGSPHWDDIDVRVVPEPASLALLALGGLMFLYRRPVQRR